MALTLAQTQAVAALAEHLAGYLPGNPHPFADQSISFAGAAKRVGVLAFWPSSGSKTPSVRVLLERTLAKDPKQFCSLVLSVLQLGIGYRQGKEPITQADVELLDALVRRVGFGIKDLRSPEFFGSLPKATSAAGSPTTSTSRQADALPSPETLDELRQRFSGLAALAPVVRGFEFEKFLGALFEAYALAPRSSFRIVGEQIDGSFELGGDPYLLEARWQGAKLGQADLLVFSGKVAGKAQWSRGVYVSYSGFSVDGISAFRVGRSTNIVCLDRSDLSFVLQGKAPLPELLRRKVRRAAEDNAAYVPASELFD